MLAVAALTWAVFTGSSQDRVVAGLVAFLTATVAVSTWSMHRRLRICPAGLEIRGPLGSRIIPWAEIQAVDAPTRRRRGLSSTSLEIDLVDETLIVLARFELGTDPAVVGEQVRHRWQLSSPQP